MKITVDVDSQVAFPPSVATQTIGILAKRGAGKSNTAAVLAEEMYAAGIPFIVIDPKGDWWGLRAARDGKGGGLEVPIFGGDHRDVPLEPGGGAELAEVIAEQRLSAVIDVSLFSKAKRLGFLADFAERLYRKNRDPLHVFLEEADDYIPQQVRDKRGGNAARCLGAWEDVFQRARTKGLGASLITQRSAVINKNVLTQCETLIVLRTTAPQDRKAIKEWIDFQGGSRDVLESLPQLRDGEAWIWSPHWLGVMERVQVRLRRTYDSGATPEDSRRGKRAARLTDIDLAGLEKRFAESVERARADDPRELRKKIASLEKELRRLGGVKSEPVRVEVPVLQDDERKTIEDLRDGIESAAAMTSAAKECVELCSRDIGLLRSAVEARTTKAAKPAQAMPAMQPREPAVAMNGAGSGQVPGGKFRAMMVALAQRGGPLTARQLATRSGGAVSGTFDKYMARMRKSGWVTGSKHELRITAEGLAALGDYAPLPTGAELRRYWLDKVGGGRKRALLEQLFAHYPEPLTSEELAAAAGGVISGTFDKYIAYLRRLELVEGTKYALKASDDLFDEG